MDMERTCSLQRCGDYRGFDIGYCHKLKVILNTEMKKEFFARNCGAGQDIESLKSAWQERSSPWDMES